MRGVELGVMVLLGLVVLLLVVRPLVPPHLCDAREAPTAAALRRRRHAAGAHPTQAAARPRSDARPRPASRAATATSR